MLNPSSSHFPLDQLLPPSYHSQPTQPSHLSQVPFPLSSQTSLKHPYFPLYSSSSACFPEQQFINPDKHINQALLEEETVCKLQAQFEEEFKASQSLTQAGSSLPESGLQIIANNHCEELNAVFSELLASSSQNSQPSEAQQEAYVAQISEADEVLSVSSIHSGDSYLSVRHLGVRAEDSDFDSTDVSQDDSYMSDSSEIGLHHELFEEC